MFEKIVKIRKPRQCHGCLCKYPVGTKMEHGVHFGEGTAWSIYFCLECVDVIKIIPSSSIPEGIEEGDVEEWVQYEFGGKE